MRTIYRRVDWARIWKTVIWNKWQKWWKGLYSSKRGYSKNWMKLRLIYRIKLNKCSGFVRNMMIFRLLRRVYKKMILIQLENKFSSLGRIYIWKIKIFRFCLMGWIIFRKIIMDWKMFIFIYMRVLWMYRISLIVYFRVWILRKKLKISRYKFNSNNKNNNYNR